MKKGKPFKNTRGLESGNYVMDKAGQLATIQTIYSELITCDIYLQPQRETFAFQSLHPILLTKLLLRHLGFIEVSDGNYYHKNGGDFNLDTKEYISISGVPEYEIKYLHTIQNIYKGLTGLDLTL